MSIANYKPEQLYLSAKELHDATGIPASTWRHLETPPSRKIGRRRVWARDDIEQFLAQD